MIVRDLAEPSYVCSSSACPRHTAPACASKKVLSPFPSLLKILNREPERLYQLQKKSDRYSLVCSNSFIDASSLDLS
jgi:hypothetical protein